MLEIKNLDVETLDSGKKILKKINLNLRKGKVYVLMGRNGSGKSTLANAIAGNPKYKVASGKINFNNKEIQDISADERAKKGIFLSFQFPAEVQGVLTSSFLRNAYNSVKEKKLSFLEFQNLLSEKARILGIKEEHISGYVNEGFSGGEKKKSEIFQALVLDPSFIIFDEIDSGLDVDSLKIISEEIKKLAIHGKTVLVITHYSKIINYLQPDEVFVIDNGEIVFKGGKEIVDKIDEKGYKWIKNNSRGNNRKKWEISFAKKTKHESFQRFLGSAWRES